MEGPKYWAESWVCVRRSWSTIPSSMPHFVGTKKVNTCIQRQHQGKDRFERKRHLAILLIYWDCLREPHTYLSNSLSLEYPTGEFHYSIQTNSHNNSRDLFFQVKRSHQVTGGLFPIRGT